MDLKRRQPIGIELVKRGIIKESDIERALEYQKEYPGKKLGDILNILKVCDSKVLIEAIGDILGEKGIYLTARDVNIDITEYHFSW